MGVREENNTIRWEGEEELEVVGDEGERTEWDRFARKLWKM